MGEARVPEIEPNFSPGLIVQLINPTGCFGVKDAQHFAQAAGIPGIAGRVGDKVVMIGEDGPGFQLPAKLLGQRQQAALQYAQSLGAAKIKFPFIG